MNSALLIEVLVLVLGLYLIVPLLRSITINKKNEEYFLCLWAIFGVVLPSLSIVSNVNIVISGITAKMYVFLPVSYSGYFVLGHYLNTYQTNRIRILWPMIFPMGGIMLVTSIRSQNIGTLDDWAYQYLNPIVVLMSIMIYIAAKHFYSSYDISIVYSKCIGTMARLSLGIYLFHVPVMILLRHIGFDYACCNTAIAVPFVSLCVYLISFVVILTISKIPVLKSYII